MGKRFAGTIFVAINFLVSCFVFLGSTFLFAKNSNKSLDFINLSTELSISNSPQVRIKSLQDNISPIVRLKSDTFRTSGSDINIDVSVNEPLITGDFTYFSLQADGEADRGLYKVTLNELKEGENEVELAFYDRFGNSTKKNITVEKRQILGESTIRGEVIWLDGDDILAVIDKEFALPSEYYPKDLVYIAEYSIPAVYGKFMLREVIIQDLSQLFADANAAHVNLLVMSAYRSYDKQRSVYNTWLSAAGITEANRVAALPGHSEHQLGTAIDFTTPEIGNSNYFDKTAAGKWLAENAYKYGFVLSYPQGSEEITGYRYEPWHYRYVGKDAAMDIHLSGKLPIVYLKEINKVYN
ncbi:M15 family metallopeptidase [Candidatus Dojkabacteria bacterium]|nr:M15 family metallopeptidase [Candidatus Dojkabacteria bacterium]